VVGRNTPSDSNKNPKIWKMRVFASDEVHAKSRFWYFLKRSNKVKKINGEILSISEVA
jgi:large subunit ribosomal protein L18Ae